MRSSEPSMMERATGWLNSILARMVGLMLGSVVLISIATTLLILPLTRRPTTSSITTYEVARQLRHLPITMSGPEFTLVRETQVPVPAADKTADLMGRALAAQLGRSPDGVRIYLDHGSQRLQRSLAALEAQYRLYGSDGGFDPPIFGSFKAAVREPDGSWLMLVRDAGANELRSYPAFWFILWMAIMIPMAWWFARRIARPIRDFSATAQRVGRDGHFEPIPLRGPTEIRLAAQSLNEMQARLGRYIAERTSVVGAIAHDLRAPLSRLNFHLASAPEKIRRNAEAEIQEMEQMIMVTLDFVEHETRPQRRDAIELALLVEGVVDNFADMGRDVRMREAACATVSGDQLMLKRLFANLLDNAVKYGGSATVDVRREADFAVVDVEDGGAGMKPSDIERAFEPFYRVEPSRSRRTGGVGLGLSIVKTVALTHGGSVELANMEAGLRARVSLPLLPGAIG